MENIHQQLLIVCVVIAVTSAINPCTNRAENEICGQAGKMTKRCRKVKPDCDGVTCHLVCVPETKGNPATVDWCFPNPCLHGTCANQQGGYTCMCEIGWSGDNCDVPVAVDWCFPNPCLHGTCANQQGGYTCICDLGWSGDNCDVPDCSDSSPLYCDCVADCPGAIDEAVCDCSGSDYSNEFATIDGAIIIGTNIGYLSNATPDQCKAYCLTTPSCITAEYDTIFGDCYLNGVSALQAAGDFVNWADYEFYSRICVCA